MTAESPTRVPALSVGLTGGIGAGKSTVTRMLEARGAVVIDADVLAREAVAAGTRGLAEVVATFGEQVLDADGALDRPALARQIFGDDRARQRLNAIVHPRVRQAAAARAAAVGPGRVALHDIPLLVENGLAADHHLVLVVGASEPVRLDRLAARGMQAADARSRMAAQATDDERRRVADIWVDNGGSLAATHAQVDRVWERRIAPYAQNLRTGSRAERPPAAALVADPGLPRTWAMQAEDILTRLRRAAGQSALSAHHIGSTAVPGLVAKDVLDLQIGVQDLATADVLADRLTAAGFPAMPGRWSDSPKDLRAEGGWEKRFHANADPGRHVNLHVRVADGPAWRFALMFRDWLRAVRAEREDYARMKQRLAAQTTSTREYAEAKEPWFDQAWPRIQSWATATGWYPPPS
ncbi:dephospho-CoA kinase [Ruania rhizosphaerae]|uniref:dephospho-CoA kinase n=1 Tax=Ruania rhizosphaerae TaxID=1840413 RepID=UPI001357E59F|nr:dephospho-CoA kinase [Ruania rhizosphaerae]